MLKRLLILIAAAALISAGSAPAAWCADPTVAVADAAMDLSVPASSALIALGLGTNMVEPPSSPREFSASLLHGVDTNGNVQTAMSVDTAPFLWYRGQERPLRVYQERYFSRFLNRTLLSFAVAHGDAVDVGTKLALGLRFTPWDDGDPRMDEELSACLRDAVLGIEANSRTGTRALQEELDELQKRRSIVERRIGEEAGQAGGELLAAMRDMLADMDRKIREVENRRNELVTMNVAGLNERTSAAITACRMDGARHARLWKRSGWSIGIVPTFISSTGTSSGLSSSGTALWTSAAFDLHDFGQLILHVHQQNNEMAPDPSVTGRLVEKDSFRAGARVRFGRPDLNFSIEGVHIIEKEELRHTTDKKIQFGAGLEHRIADDVWLAFTLGSEEYDNNDDNLIVLANLRWAHTPRPAAKH